MVRLWTKFRHGFFSTRLWKCRSFHRHPKQAALWSAGLTLILMMSFLSKIQKPHERILIRVKRYSALDSSEINDTDTMSTDNILEEIWTTQRVGAGHIKGTHKADGDKSKHSSQGSVLNMDEGRNLDPLVQDEAKAKAKVSERGSDGTPTLVKCKDIKNGGKGKKTKVSKQQSFKGKNSENANKTDNKTNKGMEQGVLCANEDPGKIVGTDSKKGPEKAKGETQKRTNYESERSSNNNNSNNNNKKATAKKTANLKSTGRNHETSVFHNQSNNESHKHERQENKVKETMGNHTDSNVTTPGDRKVYTGSENKNSSKLTKGSQSSKTRAKAPEIPKPEVGKQPAVKAQRSLLKSEKIEESTTAEIVEENNMEMWYIRDILQLIKMMII